QALGGEPDARCDLYALGAMLYEMVCGRTPFVGDSAVALISQHINTAPVAPSWHNPEIPGDLEALIVALLAKVPEKRPPSAAAVRECLAQAAASPVVPQEKQPDTALRSTSRLAWGRFVGRVDETAALRAAVDGSFGGQPALVMVAGEPGIGKTRLVEEAAVFARLRGGQ